MPLCRPGLRPLARPVAEDAVQDVERLAHLLRVRVRAEVDDAAPVPLAREHDARVVVLDRDRDVRERLVVAQPHVERRPVALDEVLLEVQRLDLGAGDDRLDVGDPRRRAGRSPGALSLEPGLEVLAHARAQRLRLADVEHLAALASEEVDAGARRQRASAAALTCSEATRRQGHRSRAMSVTHDRWTASTSPTRSSASTRRGAACPRTSARRRKDAFAEVIEEFAPRFETLSAYSTTGVRPETRLLPLEDHAAATRTSASSARRSTRRRSRAGSRRRTRTSRRRRPRSTRAPASARKIIPKGSPYLVVYPFVKVRPWYALPEEDRQRGDGRAHAHRPRVRVDPQPHDVLVRDRRPGVHDGRSSATSRPTSCT